MPQCHSLLRLQGGAGYTDPSSYTLGCPADPGFVTDGAAGPGLRAGHVAHTWRRARGARQYAAGRGRADCHRHVAAGGAAGAVAVPAAGMFVGGQPGLLRLGMERYPATPEPPPGWFGLRDIWKWARASARQRFVSGGLVIRAGRAASPVGRFYTCPSFRRQPEPAGIRPLPPGLSGGRRLAPARR